MKTMTINARNAFIGRGESSLLCYVTVYVILDIKLDKAALRIVSTNPFDSFIIIHAHRRSLNILFSLESLR